MNSGWLIGDKLLKLIVGLFVGAWVARYLGPEQYGKIAYIMAYLAIFQTIAMLGLDIIIVRNIARDSQLANQVLGTSLRLRFFISILCFIVAVIIFRLIYPEDIESLILVMLIGSGITFQTSGVIDLWFQSQIQSRRTVIAKGISYVLIAVIKVIFILLLAPLWLFAAAIGGESALSAIALYISYRKYPTIQKWKWNHDLAREMLTQSFPLLFSGIMILIYMKSSQIIINTLVDTASVGIYSVAQMLSELWYFLPMAIVTSVAPVIARKKNESEEAYTDALTNVFSLMWMISIMITILIIIFSKILVNSLFGPTYSYSASVLSIHIFTLIPVCIGVTQSLWLINENKSYLVIYQAFAGAVSAVGLNIVLIFKYGILGGAWATVISQFIQAFAINVLIAPELFKIQNRSLILLINKCWRMVNIIFRKNES
jgi:PST family polysaccharide transporter